MYNGASDTYDYAVTRDSRSFRVRLSVGGTPIDGEVMTVKSYRASSDGEDITIGKAYPQNIEVEGYIDILPGSEVYLESGLKVGSNPETYEYIPHGVFVVTNNTEEDGLITLSMYDKLYTEGKKAFDHSDIESGEAYINVCRAVASQMGVALYEDNLEQYSWISVYGYFPDACTLAEAAGYLAGMVGGNAYIGRTGMLEIHWHEDGYYTPAAGVDTVKLSGALRTVGMIEVDNGSEIITSGGGSAVRMYNPLILDYQDLDIVYENLQFLEYYAGTVDCRLADPRVDPWDIVAATTRKSVVCSSLELEYDGGMSMIIRSNARAGIEEDLDDRGPTETILDRLESDIKTSNGLYKTEERLSDGSTVYYMHDKKNLSESLQVWRFNANSISLSTDGGASYPYGLTVDGTLIQKYISAVKISAEQINAGMIEIGGTGKAAGIKVYGTGALASTLLAEIYPTGITINGMTTRGITGAYNGATGLNELTINGQDVRGLNMGIGDWILAGNTFNENTYNDLNDARNPGIYTCVNADAAADLGNTPIKTAGFRMEVRLLGQTSRGVQTVYPNSGANIFYRKWSGSGSSRTWTSWYRLTGTSV